MEDYCEQYVQKNELGIWYNLYIKFNMKEDL